MLHCSRRDSKVYFSLQLLGNLFFKSINSWHKRFRFLQTAPVEGDKKYLLYGNPFLLVYVFGSGIRIPYDVYANIISFFYRYVLYKIFYSNTASHNVTQWKTKPIMQAVYHGSQSTTHSVIFSPYN